VEFPLCASPPKRKIDGPLWGQTHQIPLRDLRWQTSSCRSSKNFVPLEPPVLSMKTEKIWRPSFAPSSLVNARRRRCHAPAAAISKDTHSHDIPEFPSPWRGPRTSSLTRCWSTRFFFGAFSSCRSPSASIVATVQGQLIGVPNWYSTNTLTCALSAYCLHHREATMYHSCPLK
jgi:hypothetical protein